MSKPKTANIVVPLDLKARLEKLAKNLGYLVENGGYKGRGSIGKMLRAIDAGGIFLTNTGYDSEEAFQKALIRKFKNDFPIHEDVCKAAFFGKEGALEELSHTMKDTPDFWLELSVQEQIQVGEWSGVEVEEITV